MNSKLLQNEIATIQKEYLELLVELQPLIHAENVEAALDEINLFWYKNINTVQLFLKTELSYKDSYVFTAVSIMDFDDREHFPFLLMGSIHILDDPLGQYSKVYNCMPGGCKPETILDNVKSIIADNIKILTNVDNEIIIVPFRFLHQPGEIEEITRLGEHFFINMFDGINSVGEYFEKCISACDIEKYIKDEAKEGLILSEHDNRKKPFEERISSVLVEESCMLENMTEGCAFFMSVFGYVQQAIDIVAACLEYKCIPFIRGFVPLHYLSMILANMGNDELVHLITYKVRVAFVVYNLFDKEQLMVENTNDYIFKIKQYGFEENLFDALNNKGINEKNYLQYDIKSIVLDELEKVYSLFN